jgi:succinate dehydrogenase/fumarate reductase-like Fe-S protein
MSNELINLKIFRYNPAMDQAPYYKNYEITWQEGLLLLPAVKYVRDNIDETLAFRDYCCGCSWCMSCLMMVNAKGMRTCSRVLHPGERILLEPMKGFPIIRDLVVDFGVNITTPEGVFKKMEGTILRRVKE